VRRFKLEVLQAWKSKKNRKPLIIKGARQVGKTWLAREFGRDFDNFVELNFEREPQLDQIFRGSLDPRGILRDLTAVAGRQIRPSESLLFLDEVQQSPAALKSLRYFHEELPELHVVAAGSLLNMVLDKVPTGVGRVNYLQLYPLCFSEYLEAAGEIELHRLLADQSVSEPLLDLHHQRLLGHVRNYMLLGGMPGVLDYFFREDDFAGCIEIQDDLIQSFFDDFHKYAKESEIEYLAAVFRSVPLQLGRKFKYVSVDPSIRSRYLSSASSLLELAGLLHKVYHSSADGLPLASRIRLNRFKVILFDTGLALRLLNVDPREWVLDHSLAAGTRGAIAEQFVGQELAAWQETDPRTPLTYWHREARGSNAEVDYLYERAGSIWPIEVKQGTRGGLKSLRLFLAEKGQTRGIKISSFGFSDDGTVVTIPFYAIDKLFPARESGR